MLAAVHPRNADFLLRGKPASAIIWHSGGAAIFGRRHEQRSQTAAPGRYAMHADPYLATLRWVYETGRMGDQGHHYDIGRDGEVLQVCEPTRMLYHARSAYRGRYNRWWNQARNREAAGEWFERYEAAAEKRLHPRSLWPLAWRGGVLRRRGFTHGPINRNAIGIGFVVRPGLALSPEQVQSAQALAERLEFQGHLHPDPDMTDHASVNPLDRNGRDGSLWDLEANQWDQLRQAGLINSSEGNHGEAEKALGQCPVDA